MCEGRAERCGGFDLHGERPDCAVFRGGGRRRQPSSACAARSRKPSRAHPAARPKAIPIPPASSIASCTRCGSGTASSIPARATARCAGARSSGPMSTTRTARRIRPSARRALDGPVQPRRVLAGRALRTGSTLALFEVKSFADEFRDKFGGRGRGAIAAPKTTEESVVRDIAETTRDFIARKIARLQGLCARGLHRRPVLRHGLQGARHARNIATMASTSSPIATNWASSRRS